MCASLPWVLAPLGLGLSGRSDSQGISQGELSGGALRGSSQGALGSSGLALEVERSAETQGDARGQWQRGEKLFICRQRDASLHVGVTGMCGQVIWICFGSWSLPGARLSQYGNGCRYKGKRRFVICKCCCRTFCGCWSGVYRVSGGWRTVLLGLRSPDTCRQFPCRAKKMDTSLGAVSIKVLFPEDILSPGSAGLRGLLRRGSESREPVPGKRGSRGAMKPWEGAKWLSDRPMDSGGGPTVLIWCSFVHGISCLVTGVSVHWCIWCPHPDIQAPVSE